MLKPEEARDFIGGEVVRRDEHLDVQIRCGPTHALQVKAHSTAERGARLCKLSGRSVTGRPTGLSGNEPEFPRSPYFDRANLKIRLVPKLPVSRLP